MSLQPFQPQAVFFKVASPWFSLKFPLKEGFFIPRGRDVLGKLAMERMEENKVKDDPSLNKAGRRWQTVGGVTALGKEVDRVTALGKEMGWRIEVGGKNALTTENGAGSHGGGRKNR